MIDVFNSKFHVPFSDGARLCAIRDSWQFKTHNFPFISDLQTMQMDIFVEFALVV